MKTEELVKIVKPAKVLSECFRKRKLAENFIRQLCITYLSDAVETDEYGEYKPGTFTFKSCVVIVEQIDDSSGSYLWRLHAMSDKQIPDSVIWEMRDRFIPNRCSMLRFYEGRDKRLENKEVVMLEYPDYDEGVKDIAEAH